MAIDDVDDDIDISAPLSSPAARTFSGADDTTFLYVIIAVIGGIALGWVIHEFMQKGLGRRRGGWGGHRGGWGRNRFAPHGDDFNMMNQYRTRRRGGPMPADYTRRDYYDDIDSNHIRDLHQVIPERRMTPLSPGYPAYVEKWNVYRDATGGIVDLGAGDY